MFRKSFVIFFLLLSLCFFVNCVSAVDVSLDEVEKASQAVVEFDLDNEKVPSSVSVSGKTIADEEFLHTAVRYTIRVSEGNTNNITIQSINSPSSPQGSGSGTLTKAQYISLARNINVYCTENGKAPNYMSSPIGNIRYESLLHAYARIMNYYRADGVLPNSMSFPIISGISSSGVTVDQTPPTTSINLQGGWYNTAKTVTLTATDNKDTNPSIYYKINSGDWIKGGKTVSLTFQQGITTLYYKAKDDKGNTETQKSVVYKIDKVGPTVNYSYNSGVLILTSIDDMDNNPTIYYNVDNGNIISVSKTATIILNEGRHIVLFSSRDAAGNIEFNYQLNITCDLTSPNFNTNLVPGWYNSTKILIINTTDNFDSNPVIAYSINGGTIIQVNNSARINLDEGFYAIDFVVADHYGNVGNWQSLRYYIDLTHPNVYSNLEDGFYNSSQTLRLNVTDNLDYNSTIYYRINGGNWISKNSNAKISLTNGTYTIEYYAVDRAGNKAPLKTLIIDINTTVIEEYGEFYPNVDSDLIGGWYNQSQNLTLETNSENLTVWYNINNTSFVSGGNKVIINLTHGYYFIQYKAVDNLGNETTVKTLMIIINEAGNLTLPGRVINYNTGKFYNDIQEAINDNETLDGDYIEVLAGIYEGNYVINKSIILSGGINGETILLPIDNKKATLFLNYSGIVVSGLTLMDNNNTIIELPSYNYTTQGAIYINGVSNCTIINNDFINNTCSISNNESKISNNNWIMYNNIQSNVVIIKYSPSERDFHLVNVENYFIGYNNFKIHESAGIFLVNISKSLIYANNIKQEEFPQTSGLLLFESLNNTIMNNLFINFTFGLFLFEVNNISIIENIFIDNENGISLARVNNTNISFNSFQSREHSLFIQNFESFEIINVNATNNWWGTNSPTLGIYFEDGDIMALYDLNGGLYFDPWIVASISPTSYKVSDGKIYESIVTVDLTHNSNGEDISALGCIPDGGIVNFNSQYGNITNSSVVVDGKASAILTFNTTVNDNKTGVMAFIDDEMVYDFIDNKPFIEVWLFSSAIDQETGYLLNITHKIENNGSLAWVTVLWRETGLFTADIDLIYDGEVILTKHITNLAYELYKNSYREEVFKAINDYNIFIGSKSYESYGLLNQDEAISLYLGFLINEYNLSSDELGFIMSNHFYFIDTLYDGINYFGDSNPKFIILNSETGEYENIALPGNPSYRMAPIFYDNGIYDGHDTGFEGLKSYAIAYSNVTSDDLSYWVSQKNLFSPGAMKAAYGTFLTALLVIYEHDRIADQAAKTYNVTWDRKTPVMVSMNNDVEDAYITGESDHNMGMDVIGDPINVYNFRLTCSFAFSLVEELVAHNVYNTTDIGSVTLGILQHIAEGEKFITYYSNGYLIVYTEENNNSVLYIDLINGIVRDVHTGNILGVPCFHDGKTNQSIEYGENLLNSSNGFSEQLEIVGNASIMFGGVFGSLITGSVTSGGIGTSIAGLTLSNPIGVLIVGTFVLAITFDACRPLFADIYDYMGKPDLAEYYRNNNVFDMLVDMYSFDPIIDKLMGLPPGTHASLVTIINPANILRAGIIISLTKKQIPSINGGALITGLKEAQKYKNSGSGDGNESLFILNWFRAAKNFIKTGSQNIVDGIATKSPSLVAKGIAKVTVGTGIAEFGTFYAIFQHLPNLGDYIVKVIKNI